MILDLLRRLNLEHHTSVIVVTHDAFAATYGHRTIEMQDGRIVRDVGSVADFAAAAPRPAAARAPAGAVVVLALRRRVAELRLDLPQLAMAILVIALGVALAAGVLLANRSLRDRFDESVDALAGVADLQISAVSGGTFDESVLEEVRATPGVAAAARSWSRPPSPPTPRRCGCA